MAEPCIFCERPAIRYSKRRGERVCDHHFMTTCPECGHEAFWMSTESRPEGRFVCFRIVPHVCRWESEQLPATAANPSPTTKTTMAKVAIQAFETVSVPVALWRQFDDLVKRGREMRTNPANWPLTPDRMAQEIVAVHHALRAIDDSEDYRRVAAVEAIGTYAKHVNSP